MKCYNNHSYHSYHSSIHITAYLIPSYEKDLDSLKNEKDPHSKSEAYLSQKRKKKFLRPGEYLLFSYIFKFEVSKFWSVTYYAMTIGNTKINN